MIRSQARSILLAMLAVAQFVEHFNPKALKDPLSGPRSGGSGKARVRMLPRNHEAKRKRRRKIARASRQLNRRRARA